MDQTPQPDRMGAVGSRTAGLAVVTLGCAAMLLVALARLPYAYYQALRWVVCAGGAWLAIRAYRAGIPWAVWLFAVLAVVFNPIAPFHFRRQSWAVLNVVAAVLFLLGGGVVAWRTRRKTADPRARPPPGAGDEP